MTHEPLDKHIADAFARLRSEIDVPPIDPVREEALLAAFDSHWARPRPRVRRWGWIAAAASIAMAAVLGWPGATNTPSHGADLPASPAETDGFTAWPGADALPPFESGELMRVDLPAASLAAFGLLMPPGSSTVVQAEIVVGQDGLARAVRFLQH